MAKRDGGFLCFLLAALLLFVGARNVIRKANGPTPPSGSIGGYAVGSMLPAVVMLGIGVWLFQSPKRR